MKKQIKKPRFRTNLNYQWLPEYGELPVGESLTVPGESYSIPALLERARNGVPLNSLVEVRPDYYASEEDFDAFTHDGDIDLVDIHKIAEESTATIKQAEEQTQKAQTRQKSAKQSNEAVKTESEATESIESPNEP